MSLPGSPDTGVGISSIFSLFPPAKSPSGSTSLSNGELPVPNFSPSISSFFPPNNSPSSSESAPVKQSSPSISFLFPPTHSQSNSLSSTGTIHELANTICSIFRPNCSYSSSSESSHDQVTSKIKILDHEMEDVTSSYIEGLDQLRSGLLQQQKPYNPFKRAPQPFHQLQKLTPQHQQQLQQHALSNLQSQSSNHNPHQQDKMGGAASVTMDGSMSNSFRNDQGLDQLRSGLLQQQKPYNPFKRAPQPFHQLQKLTPQHQQLLLHFFAQQNLTSPSASDQSRRLRMLLSSRAMNLGKDALTNSVGDVVPNVGSLPQAASTLFDRGDTDMLIKLKMAELHQQQQQNSNPQQQQQQQLQQHALSNLQSQSSNHNLHQQDKMGGAASVTMDGSMSNSFRNDQVSKNQTGRKRKQPVSSSGPANSSGTANMAGPSPSSAPSTMLN